MHSMIKKKIFLIKHNLHVTFIDFNIRYSKFVLFIYLCVDTFICIAIWAICFPKLLERTLNKCL